MQWFKDLNATPRLLLSFGVMVLSLLAVSLLSIRDLGEADQRMQVLSDQDWNGLLYVDEVAISHFELAWICRDGILNMQHPEIVADDEKVMLADFKKIHSGLDEADKRFYAKEGTAALHRIRESLPAYEQAYHVLFQRIHARDMDGSRAALLAVNAAGALLYTGVVDARRIKLNHAAEKHVSNAASVQAARTILMAVTLLAVVLGVMLAIVLARGFSVPLALAVDVLEKLALGDLTVSLHLQSRDEVGRMARALNQAVAKLRATLQDVAENAANASIASQELAAAADAIASGAQQQAASLEQTSASLEQITATVRQSADNARQASQLASGSRDTAESGQHVVSDAITAMAEINVASAKISDIISTIDEIAFQTNLLAVNAAIEAARAGEEGRGFAVVATEVRTLAQRSAGAAKEIKNLIQDTLRKVGRGTELVNQSGETLQSIVGSVKGVTNIVNEIAAAAAEQSTGVEQVNTAMTQMDQVTQANAGQTEHLSSTAQALSEQSLRLKELLGTFLLGDDRGPAHMPFARPIAAARHSATAARPKARGAVASASQAISSNWQRPGRLAAHLAVAKAGSSDHASFEEF